VEVKDVIAEISRQTKGSFTDPYVAGNVGAGALKRFNLIFNYEAQTVVFEPNANRDTAEGFDRSGMWLNLDQGALAVMDVTAKGPAETAGLMVGDHIVSVDGAEAASLSLPDVRRRFRSGAPGTEVRLRVERDGSTREVTLVLRDQI
jgi:C-terminal processing protease CtpA/Prc